MRKIIAAATVAGALFLATGRGQTRSARIASHARPATSALVTTTRAPTTTTAAPSTSAHATTTRPRVVTPHQPPGSTKAKRGIGQPKTTVHKPRPTITLSPTQLAALRELALKTCLVSAATSNLRVVAANNAWYQRQVAALAAHKKTFSARYAALVIEESSTKDLIDAQYTIDESNCYIKYA
jgi:hypothetical protein